MELMIDLIIRRVIIVLLTRRCLFLFASRKRPLLGTMALEVLPFLSGLFRVNIMLSELNVVLGGQRKQFKYSPLRDTNYIYSTVEALK